MNKNFILLFVLLSTIVTNVVAQTQKDTIYTFFSKEPVILDGSDVDACWTIADWHAMDQVWIPFNEVMDNGDFEGKYKVAWDKDYLYVFVEVEDNILSDDHSNPTDNYWNDDCVEIFIDEDRSGGDHLSNNNAFAYHCSVFYDVIDGAGTNGTTINCKKNITMVMDTIGNNIYRWEFAVKMYNKSFNYNNPEISRVFLTPKKLMGFSIAYCDNDETNGRENFIGSVEMPEANANDSYKNSSFFGTMLLVDPDHEWVSNTVLPVNGKKVSIFPNPATNKITISRIPEQCNHVKLEIFNVAGTLVRSMKVTGVQTTIEISDLKKGIYFLNVSSDSFSQCEKFVKR